MNHPGGNSGSNFDSISHICHLWEVEFEWDLTDETIYLPLGCLQGGEAPGSDRLQGAATCERIVNICERTQVLLSSQVISPEWPTLTGYERGTWS